MAVIFRDAGSCRECERERERTTTHYIKLSRCPKLHSKLLLTKTDYLPWYELNSISEIKCPFTSDILKKIPLLVNSAGQNAPIWGYPGHTFLWWRWKEFKWMEFGRRSITGFLTERNLTCAGYLFSDVKWLPQRKPANNRGTSAGCQCGIYRVNTKAQVYWSVASEMLKAEIL